MFWQVNQLRSLEAWSQISEGWQSAEQDQCPAFESPVFTTKLHLPESSYAWLPVTRSTIFSWQDMNIADFWSTQYGPFLSPTLATLALQGVYSSFLIEYGFNGSNFISPLKGKTLSNLLGKCCIKKGPYATRLTQESTWKKFPLWKAAFFSPVSYGPLEMSTS